MFLCLRKRFYSHFRWIYSITGVWDPELTNEMKIKMEHLWRDKVNTLENTEVDKPKYYLLSMFPYPSGYLHMGHVRVYTISDAIARFQRMRGYKVIHPIGWDAFGLPAENAAIEKNIHPAEWTAKNIAVMKSQLQMLNISFDWDLELTTSNPSYYKWTQHLFLLMYEKGLAYKKESVVNWDPVDQTVLADEQVDENGISWRSGCKVEKRSLEQWFFRTTAFAKELYDGLNSSELVNWRDAKKIQQNWIGECTGYNIHFKVFFNGTELNDTLPVWTDSPELIYGASFIAISPEHHFNSPKFRDEIKVLEDYVLNIEVAHPLTGSMLPVYVTRSFQYTPATNSILGIPGSTDEISFAFAIQNQLDVIPVINKGSRTLINSEEFSQMDLTKAKEMIISKIQENGVQIHPSSQTLRDWLISRQRYWGTPIPIINCPKCQVVPVPFNDLPVVLPHFDEFTGKGCSLKSAVDHWLKVKCPKCGGDALRETDTMDTFVDSSWYFLRYLDVDNINEPFNQEKIKKSMPVDLYIGGKEHAALHLFYARFIVHFYHSLGMLKSPEPFVQLLMQGMIQGQSYQIKETGKYIPKSEVDFSGSHPVEKTSGSEVIVDWEKMSKSKFNGIDPQAVIDEHGIDTTRLFILGNVTPQSPRKWNDDLFPGIFNWQRRIWLTVSNFITQRKDKNNLQQLTADEIKEFNNILSGSRNYYVKGATHNFVTTRQLSVSISKLQGLTGDLRKVPVCLAKDSKVYEETLATLIIMLSPLAPHFAAELWAGFCSVATGSSNYDLTKPVSQQKWPVVDDDYNMRLVIRVNGEECDEIPMLKNELEKLDKDTAISLALSSAKLQEAIDFTKPKIVIWKFPPDYDMEVNVIYPAAKKLKKSKSKSCKSKIVQNTSEIKI